MHVVHILIISVGDIKSASRCVASFLLFYPNDSKMLSNKDYYLNNEDADSAWMDDPREEALEYFKRDEYERQLLDFIDGPAAVTEDEQPPRGDVSYYSYIKDCHLVQSVYQPAPSSSSRSRLALWWTRLRTLLTLLWTAATTILKCWLQLLHRSFDWICDHFMIV